jgi:hypothetical protein
MSHTDSDDPTPNKKQWVGRPEDSAKLEAFLRVTKFVEDNDDEQITVCDLVDQMKQYSPDTEAYSVPYMKRKLCEHFGDKIIIAELNGTRDVVTFRNTAASVLHDFYYLPKKQDPDTEKLRIVETAAHLIKNDIKSMAVAKDIYPSPEDISSVEKNLAFLPETVHLLLQKLFIGTDAELKIASLGQAIMQATRPHVLIAPLHRCTTILLPNFLLTLCIIMDTLLPIPKLKNLKQTLRHLKE